MGVKAGDLTTEGGTCFYSYRGKGDKTGRRQLPGPAYEAICETLADAGKTFPSMAHDESLWQAGAGQAG